MIKQQSNNPLINTLPYIQRTSRSFRSSLTTDIRCWVRDLSASLPSRGNLERHPCSTGDRHAACCRAGQRASEAAGVGNLKPLPASWTLLWCMWEAVFRSVWFQLRGVLWFWLRAWVPDRMWPSTSLQGLHKRVEFSQAYSSVMLKPKYC